jgi:hypothetical protein
MGLLPYEIRSEFIRDSLERPMGDATSIVMADPADAARTGGPGEDLAIVGVAREPDPHRLAIPARDLEHVGGPALVRRWRRDLAIVRALTTAAGMRRQQQARPLHHAWA